MGANRKITEIVGFYKTNLSTRYYYLIENEKKGFSARTGSLLNSSHKKGFSTDQLSSVHQGVNILQESMKAKVTAKLSFWESI